MEPKIAIILPVYNGMPYLVKSVESVLQQEYADFEFYILDDSSTDDSWQYLQTIRDSRVRLSRNPHNLGLFPNLNILISNSSAPLIKLWSQDDIMYPQCIGETIKFHLQTPQLGFSYSGRDLINESGAVTATHHNDPTPVIISKDLHAASACYTGSIAGNIANVTISRSALKTCGLFNENMKISGDFEMWVRLSLQFPIGFIRQNLVKLRNHAQQLSRQEKFYIHHVKEDISAYKILFNGLTVEQSLKGRRLLRQNKLMFYYTLMLQSFLKGKITTGFDFLGTLHRFDNIFLLSFYYFKMKLTRKPTVEIKSL